MLSSKTEALKLAEWHEDRGRENFLEAQRYPIGSVKKSLEDISVEHQRWATLIREMLAQIY